MPSGSPRAEAWPVADQGKGVKERRQRCPRWRLEIEDNDDDDDRENAIREWRWTLWRVLQILTTILPCASLASIT
jgi:hypothetical protein